MQHLYILFGKMKTKIITYILFLAMLPLFGQAPDITWQQCFGTPTKNTEIQNIVKTKNGFLIAFQVAESDTMITNYHGPTMADGWLVSTDSLGNILWERCYGGSSGDGIDKIILIDSTSYYLFGATWSYDGDVQNSGPRGFWAIKIDTLGNILWENSYGNDRCDARDAILMPDGGLLMMGRIMEAGGDVSTYYGSNDLWLCKIDSIGNLEWEKTIGNEGLENATKIKLTAENTLLITGSFTEIGGMITSDYHGSADVWIVELDLQGTILQQFGFGGSHIDQGWDIIKTEDGYVFAASTNSNDGDVTGFHGESGDDQPYDLWVCKIDFEGNLVWQKCLGGSGHERPYYLTQTQAGGYIVIGLTNSDDGDVSGIHDDLITYNVNDVWMVKLSSEGELEWQHCYGTYDRESFSRHSILKLSDDNFVIGVQTQPSVGGDKTCYRDYSPGLQYWPRMAWLFNLKNCSNYQPATPQAPTGPDTLCHTTDTTSVYTLTPATGAWGYIWQLQPEEAGTLVQDSLSATITWNTGYQGEVQISASSYNDCGQSAFSEVKTTFVYTCVGLEENAANGFGLRVYPNPANDFVTFETTGNKPTLIIVYNHTGQLVEMLELNASRTNWHVGSLPRGLYFYRAEQDGKLVVGKLVVSGE